MGFARKCVIFALVLTLSAVFNACMGGNSFPGGYQWSLSTDAPASALPTAEAFTPSPTTAETIAPTDAPDPLTDFIWHEVFACEEFAADIDYDGLADTISFAGFEQEEFGNTYRLTITLGSTGTGVVFEYTDSYYFQVVVFNTEPETRRMTVFVCSDMDELSYMTGFIRVNDAGDRVENYDESPVEYLLARDFNELMLVASDGRTINFAVRTEVLGTHFAFTDHIIVSGIPVPQSDVYRFEDWTSMSVDSNAVRVLAPVEVELVDEAGNALGTKVLEPGDAVIPISTDLCSAVTFKIKSSGELGRLRFTLSEYGEPIIDGVLQDEYFEVYYF